MSLYNMVMGVNPYAGLLLALLGFTDPSAEIPRLRDCYVDSDGHIVVFTRTGGSNRREYAAQNAQLAARPGYVRTEDWATDTTFAKWLYRPTPEQEALVRQAAEHGARMDPTAKFEQAMADMSSPNPTAGAKAVVERARPTMQRLAQQLQAGGSAALLDSDHTLARADQPDGAG